MCGYAHRMELSEVLPGNVPFVPEVYQQLAQFAFENMLLSKVEKCGPLSAHSASHKTGVISHFVARVAPGDSPEVG